MLFFTRHIRLLWTGRRVLMASGRVLMTSGRRILLACDHSPTALVDKPGVGLASQKLVAKWPKIGRRPLTEWPLIRTHSSLLMIP